MPHTQKSTSTANEVCATITEFTTEANSTRRRVILRDADCVQKVQPNTNRYSSK